MIAIDMEMPKGCEDCPFVDEYGECLLLPGCQKLEWGRRLPNCPLRELVRCKDCKHFYVGKFANGCFLDHDENVNSLPPDFFCADGERKGEDDDTD